MTDKVSTWLWCGGTAEEQARLYTDLIPDSRIVEVQRSPADNPGNRAGEVMTVEFTLAGRSVVALNGGPGLPYSEAISFQILCDDQAEVDRYADALSAVPDKEQCGWVKDRFGLSWQIVPRILPRLLGDPDRAKAKRVMDAMLSMRRLDIATLEAAAAGNPTCGD